MVDHPGAQPLDRGGGSADCLGRVHASGRYCRRLSVVPLAFEYYYHRELSSREDNFSATREQMQPATRCGPIE